MIGKCKVKFKKEEKEAKLYGIYQHSHVKQAMLRGEVGGVIAYPIAVVDWGEGLKEIPLNVIKDIKDCNDVKHVYSNDYPLDAIRLRYAALSGMNLAQLVRETLSE